MKEMKAGNVRIRFVQDIPITAAIASFVDTHKVIATATSICHENDVWDSMVGMTKAFGYLKNGLAKLRQDSWFIYPELLTIPPTQVIEKAFYDAFKKELKG